MVSSCTACKGLIITFLILQTFSILLCASTYINHNDLLKDSKMGEYIRHRIKKTIIPATSSKSYTNEKTNSRGKSRRSKRSDIRRWRSNSRTESRNKRSLHPNAPGRSFPFQHQSRTSNFQHVETLINLVNQDDGATQVQRLIVEETLLSSLLNHGADGQESHQSSMETSTSRTSTHSSSRQSLHSLDHINISVHTPSPSHSSNNVRHHRGERTSSLSETIRIDQNIIEIETTTPQECPEGYCLNGGSCTVRGPLRECMCISSYIGDRCQSLSGPRMEPEGRRESEIEHYASWAIGWLTRRHGIRHANRFQTSPT